MSTTTAELEGKEKTHVVDSKGEKPLKSTFMKVTPAQAQEWLDNKNRRNRPVRDSRVDRYGDQMQDGDWMASPDAIAFDYNGRLINGQHRLKAVVRSQSPQVMLVAWNLHPDAFMISDVGIKRTAADALAIEGFTSPQELAATVRLVALWHSKELSLDQCTEYELVQNATIVELAERCSPRIQESVRLVGEHKQDLISLMPRSLFAFVHFMYTPTYGRRPEQFVKAFCDPAYVENWEKKFADDPDVDEDGVKDPAALLKDKMEKDARTSGKMDRREKLGYLIQAMNWYCAEEPHKRLRRSKGGLPEMEIDQLPEFTDQVEMPME